LTKIEAETVAGLVRPVRANEPEPVEVAGFTARVTVLEIPPEVPVNVTVCAVLTADTVALNPAVVAPAAMFMLAGTVTEELLLDRFTAVVDCAAEVRETVQAVVIGPVNVEVLQKTWLNVAVAVVTGFTARVKVLEILPEVPVNVTVCAVLTADAVALNPAVVAPAAILRVAGTVTAELLLDRFTEVLRLAAAVR
jgi:hypothetical protein